VLYVEFAHALGPYFLEIVLSLQECFEVGWELSAARRAGSMTYVAPRQ
jgi:hypothetical protein